MAILDWIYRARNGVSYIISAEFDLDRDRPLAGNIRAYDGVANRTIDLDVEVLSAGEQANAELKLKARIQYALDDALPGQVVHP